MQHTNHQSIRFEGHLFYEHERIMLAAGVCPGVFPMKFLRSGQRLDASYDISGFAPLRSFRIERTEDALFLLEETLFILRRLPEYLLQPERILIRSDTVFYCKDSNTVRLAYVPHEAASEGMTRELLVFFAQLKKDLSDGQDHLLDLLARDMYRRNLNIEDLLRRLGLLRRKLPASPDE